MRATKKELEDLQTATKIISETRADLKLAEAERYIVVVRALVQHGLQPEEWQICLACGLIRLISEIPPCMCTAQKEDDPIIAHELASLMQ